MTQISKAQQSREGSFGFLIQTLARRIDATMKERLRDSGVDYKVFANLMALAEQDGINQRQLGLIVEFPEYFISRNIDALVEAGFAERKRDPNSRRSYLIFLTKAGKEKAAALRGVVRETNEEYLAGLSKDERAQVVALLRKAAGVSAEQDAS